MPNKEDTCYFCGSSAVSTIIIETPLYYRGYKKEIIPFCGVGCINRVLENAGSWPNKAIEMAITIVEKLKGVDPGEERKTAYRQALIKKATRYAGVAK